MSEVQKSYKPKWPLITSIVLGVISLTIIVIYSQTVNMFLGILAVPFIGATVYFFTRWQNTDYSGVKLAPGNVPTGDVNCFSIYARKAGDKIIPVKVAFESVTKPEGVPWRFPQLGNLWLPIMIFNVESGSLEPLQLPDAEYCDPRVLAEAVNMTANNEYAKEEVTLLRQLRPWIMIAACGIGGIILVAVG